MARSERLDPASLHLPHGVKRDRTRDAASAPLSLTAKLSSRLLWLTIAFVMLAEIAVFAPSMARFRRDYLNDKLATAHLVLTALEASPEQIDPELRDRLLAQGGMLGMTAMRPNMPARTLGPRMPSRIPDVFDLRDDTAADLIMDAMMLLVHSDTNAMAVTGVSPSDPAVVVEVVLDEAPLRAAMLDFARRILGLSIFISFTTAAMVYASLQWLAVRPLRRLTASMIGFMQAPEDPQRVIVPSQRHDEVGVAERTLATMQDALRESLLQKERLAGVGTAVTKISHDLKNILATAMLESDRLEQSSDPEVRRLTAGLLRAVDRAVALAASTLKFAREGVPHVHARALNSGEFLRSFQTALQPGLKTTEVRLGDVEDFTFTADPELLQRALENLLRNAAEAGASRVALNAQARNGKPVIFVSDNGQGLPPRALESLFVPFAGSARAEGTGLGLPIARELMRAQGGDLVLDRTGPNGATFALNLPV